MTDKSSARQTLSNWFALIAVVGSLLGLRFPANADESIEGLLARDRCETRSSINDSVQTVLDTELAEARARFHATAAWALLSNTQTGEILGYSEHGNVPQAGSSSKTTAGVRAPEVKLISIAVGLDAGTFDLDTKVDLRKRKDRTPSDSFLDRWGTVRETFIFASDSDALRLLMQQKIKLEPVFRETTAKAEKSLSAASIERSVLLGIQPIYLGYGVHFAPVALLALNAAAIGDGKPSPLSFHKPLPAGCNSPSPPSFVQPATGLAIRSLLRLNGQIGSVKKANSQTVSVGGEAGVLRSTRDKPINFFLGAFPIEQSEYQIFLGLEDAKSTTDTFGFSSPAWNVVPAAGKLIARLNPLLLKTIPANSNQ